MPPPERTRIEGRDPFIGRVLDGRFTIQSELGRGGMGVVYRAYQASLERPVALKVMTGTGEPAKDAEFQRRFFLEAATAAKLTHPNTITVFDYGSSVVDGSRVFFIAMELLEGTTLSAAMGKQPMDPLRAVHVAVQICRSLREAHKAGVVHRDLKPGNVMLVKADDADEVEGDFVKVLDFGLAKTGRVEENLTKAGTFLGSPRYVAPEQIEGRPVDARADIYSFGCLFYRMLAGVVPFDGVQPVEIMMKHLHEPPPPLPAHVQLPIALEKLVLDCLEKSAERRPPSMDVVLTRLKLVRAELGGRAFRALSDETSRKRQAAPPPELSDPGQRATVAANVDVAKLFADDDSDELVPPPRPARPQTAVERIADVVIEDSTRPTRVLGRLQAQPKRSSLPLLSLLLVVSIAAVGAFAWRSGLAARFLGTPPPPSPTPAAPAPTGPARQATIRVQSAPPGADVVEVQDGLPKLLGTTPLTLPWRVEPGASARVLTLKMTGRRPVRATVQPPAPHAREPIWIAVDAVLVEEAR